MITVYPVSRLMCDPERFTDDGAEPMSRKGMGVIYTRTSDGRVLRPSLEIAVEGLQGKYGRVLVVDCHSFPSMPLRPWR